MGIMSRIVAVKKDPAVENAIPLKPHPQFGTPPQKKALPAISSPKISPPKNSLATVSPPQKNAPPKNEPPKSAPPKFSPCKKCQSRIFWFPKNPNLENRPYCVDCDFPSDSFFVRAVMYFAEDGTSERLYNLPCLGIGPAPRFGDVTQGISALADQPPSDTYTFLDGDGVAHERRTRYARDTTLQGEDETAEQYAERCELGHQQAVWAERIARQKK